MPRTNLLRLEFIYCVRKRFVAQLKTEAQRTMRRMRNLSNLTTAINLCTAFELVKNKLL